MIYLIHGHLINPKTTQEVNIPFNQKPKKKGFKFVDNKKQVPVNVMLQLRKLGENPN